MREKATHKVTVAPCASSRASLAGSFVRCSTESGSSAPLRRRNPRRFAPRSALGCWFAVLCPFLAAMSARAQGTYEAYSPVVSYIFEDTLASADAYSPVVSYVFMEALPDDVTTTFSSSPVSYFYNVGSADPSVTVSGRVLDERGQGLAGARVALSVPGQMFGSTVTTGEGGFSFLGVAQGVYVLKATAPGRLADERSLVLTPRTGSQRLLLRPVMPTPDVVAVAEPPSKDLPVRDVSLDLVDTRLLAFDGSKFARESVTVSKLKMTIVMTHGWNSSSKAWAEGLAAEMSRQQPALDGAANILAWDWSSAAQRPVLLGPPDEDTPRQGAELGRALYALLGQDYEGSVHFLGHSLGTLVNRYAADYLHGNGGVGKPLPGPAWLADRSHLTLFDEAELSAVKNYSPLRIYSWLAAMRRSRGGRLEVPDPLPAWLDRQLRLVGRVLPTGRSEHLSAEADPTAVGRWDAGRSARHLCCAV